VDLNPWLVRSGPGWDRSNRGLVSGDKGLAEEMSKIGRALDEAAVPREGAVDSHYPLAPRPAAEEWSQPEDGSLGVGELVPGASPFSSG
jgi:hypothetical protein